MFSLIPHLNVVVVVVVVDVAVKNLVAANWLQILTQNLAQCCHRSKRSIASNANNHITWNIAAVFSSIGSRERLPCCLQIVKIYLYIHMSLITYYQHVSHGLRRQKDR